MEGSRALASPCSGDGKGVPRRAADPAALLSMFVTRKSPSRVSGQACVLHLTPAPSSPGPPSQVSAAPRDDGDDDVDRLSDLGAWAERMEGVWNDVLEADARGSKPRVTLPGFPIHVRQAKTERKRLCVVGVLLPRRG